ncbi:Uu.00g020610.m01.CDS01 [Anthostomella pinea]|uniref:Uu.00g020610.m01.CDS01 n=1 Tax=Anthostomella pinea TaxID=933095 RepID=A0AAI8VZJ4_9PEZI|nr:Uu.00g020610.m01.CDS01 [Anthostomella pinea]
MGACGKIRFGESEAEQKEALEFVEAMERSGPKKSRKGDEADAENFFDAMREATKETTPTEARREARQLSESIFSSWKQLSTILDKREEVRQKRWTKKTKNQRAQILLAAWPCIGGSGTVMPVSHRPDMKLILQPNARKTKASFMWPYINLEDLSDNKFLPLMLSSRGRNLPEAFAHADLEALHAGITIRIVHRTRLKNHTMYLARQTSPETYGQLVSWDDNDQAFDLMHNQIQFSPGDGLLVLDV